MPARDPAEIPQPRTSKAGRVLHPVTRRLPLIKKVALALLFLGVFIPVEAMAVTRILLLMAWAVGYVIGQARRVIRKKLSVAPDRQPH